MLKRYTLISCVFILCILIYCFMFIVGCGNSTASMLDPDANMIGTEVNITEDIKFNIEALIESNGSDYIRPSRDFTFDIVKFKVTNDSEEKIELNESDFSVLVSEKPYTPITGKLNFVPDKMPEKVSIESGSKYITKLVWELPKKPQPRVFIFKPSFAPQSEIKYNLVETDSK